MKKEFLAKAGQTYSKRWLQRPGRLSGRVWAFNCWLLVLWLSGCAEEPAPLFTTVDPGQSGVHFSNDLHYTEEYNPYTYRNFYNGGGVALGDINNDGLLDIYFSGNLVSNKLYLNKGNLQFEDITEQAGVACAGVWSSGVNMVDINGDGWLDLYVCKAGKPEGANRHNELFINQGDLTFVEQSKAYGLDITGLSIQSAFFDYDLDGDLDCYLLNNSLRSVGGFDMKEGLRDIYDPEGNKLLENQGGKFVDVTRKAGIYSSSVGYGLGITLADFNWDGWPDIFLSNDFFEKDYLYFNNQDGTFTERVDSSFTSLSMGSMGADACDLDNDLLPEIFVTEMSPRAADRKKTKTTYENWDKYQLAVTKGYHHQFARNVLHKNLDGGQFVELGRLAGIESSDWSWSALIQDFDNDGLRDIFISNGIRSDLLDKDYLNYMANDTRIQAMIDEDEDVLKKLIDIMPSGPVNNAIFKNNGQLNFTYQSQAWGLDAPTFSNGSAYGDLDNDGDLELVINNVDQAASIYRNNSDPKVARSIAISLQYRGANRQAIGAKVLIYADTLQSMFEYYPAKGFQSCSAAPLFFGLGQRELLDSLIVIWPNGEASVRTRVPANQSLTISYEESERRAGTAPFKPGQTALLQPAQDAFSFTHQETGLNFFDQERMLLSMPGRKGPAIAVADVNQDRVKDVFIGGGKNQESVLFLSGNGGYTAQYGFSDTRRSEVTAAEFFDSDRDGDLDLYVAHGGKGFSIYAPELHDALYLNDGAGVFTRSGEGLRFPYPISTGDIAIADLTNDGLPDIVLGEAMKTNGFGLPGNCFIFINDGNNQFSLLESELCKELGMITAVEIADINTDGWADILLAGQYMPATILFNEKGAFQRPEQRLILTDTEGLWNCIEKADLDDDGDPDFVLGNLGQNNFFRDGLTVFVHDFDGNGTIEQIACQATAEGHFPVHDIDELYSQMPILKKAFRTYREFSQAPLEALVPEEQLQKALQLHLKESRSLILWNEAGRLVPVALPRDVQYSTVNAILAGDFNQDGIQDLLLGGNDYKYKPQFGRQDASLGWVCYGEKSKGDIIFADCRSLDISGQIRAIESINQHQIVIGINDGEIKVYEY
ncbi:MAG: VCBS repeat-containing protein [Lewinellaceae bacterium]|nr:VCBS repeat-containing protein [Phaeodactylibacter sp.]MCB9346094.1 VCBS repeat-containing protein [Lewinellaceae bacterium]